MQRFLYYSCKFSVRLTFFFFKVTCPCNEVPLIAELESEPSAASSPPHRAQCGAVLQSTSEAKTQKGLLTRCLQKEVAQVPSNSVSST